MKPRKPRVAYWWDVIEQAKKRKKAGELPFTPKQVVDAGPWLTCACGRLDPQIPRNPDGAPKDALLYEYGVEFVEAVVDQRPGLAEQVLRKIEKQAAIILAETEKVRKKLMGFYRVISIKLDAVE